MTTITDFSPNNPSLWEEPPRTKLWQSAPSVKPEGLSNNDFVKDRVRRLVRSSSLEVTPSGAGKVESFLDLLEEQGTRIFITFLPGSDLAETTKTAVRLAREGFNPVPHIAARSLASEVQLEEALKAWRQEAGVEEVLLVGGTVAKPLGPFTKSMDVLRLGLLEKHGIKRVGLAAHPEGSPDIAPDELRAYD